MNRMRTLAFLAAMFFVAPAAIHAQVTGRVTGTVVDASGAAIPDATVSLQLPGSGAVAYTTKSSAAGDFNLLTVPSNTYDLVVEASGFLKAVVSGLKVDPGRATDVPSLKLEIQGVTQTVEVSAATTSVQTSNAEVSTTITKSQIANLPVLNRSPLAFLTTQAGINYGAGSTTINGQRATYVNVTVDGINVQDNFIRTNDLDFLPNLLLLDQVAEVTVSTSNASSASYGGSSQVQFTTPSGGNQYHGSAYWSNRNNYFAANTWFNNKSGTAVPFLNQNQLGGSIGGPVVRNKLFFYSNFEAFRLRQQSSINTTVLTPDARNGIFTYRDTAGATQRVNVLQAMGLQADPTVAGIIAKVPTSFNNYDNGDSTAAFVRNTAGYRFNQRNNRTRNNLTAKGDYMASPKNSFTLTVMYNTDFLDRGDTLVTFQQTPSVQNDNTTKFVSAAWRFNPLPTVTNELRFGFNIAPGLFISSHDIPNYIVAPTLITNPINNYRSQGRYTNTYHVSDNANWVRGAHTVSFGVQGQRVRIESFNDASITPTFTLGLGGNQALTNKELPGVGSNDLTSANNLLALVAGYVSAYNQTFNVNSRTSGFVNGATNRRNFTNDNYAVYAQDSWKLSRRLTVNAGVRWDYYLPVDECDALSLLPVLKNDNVISTVLDPATTLDFAGKAVGRPWYAADKNNFAPNLGLAWDPTGEGKWAVRAGYSISFVNDSVVRATDNSTSTNAGLQQSVSATGLAAKLSNRPTIATPAFKVPRTLADNYLVNTSAAVAMPAPDMATPYVQQWNIGVQRTIKSTLIDVRYVGNHGTKEIRGIDYNQVLIGALLPDFLKAQNNGLLAQRAGGAFDPSYNANIAGSQPLPFFSLLPGSGNLANGTVRSNIQTGQVGELANFYQTSRINGNVNFYNNPNILGANVLTNYSNSSYNALQLDLVRRFANGFQFQANYSYSRAYGDAQGDQQTNFEPFLDINNARLERSRPAAYDNTHVFKANGFWQLPFGPKHRLNSSNKVVQKLIEGWNLGGIYTMQSGAPFGIYSARGTLNRAGRSANNTMNTFLNKAQLDELFTFRMTGNGPMMVPDSVKNPLDGRAVAGDGLAPFAGQVFFMPAAGTLGTLQRNYFSGPSVWDLDLRVGKVIQVTERKTLELRGNAANVFNHPNFFNPTTTPTSTTFGNITGTYTPGGNSRRLLQFELYFRF